MNYLPFPPEFPPKKSCRRAHFRFVIADEGVENVSCRRWSWTSKGRPNFFLQHETREMGLVVNVVLQIRGWIRRIINRRPDLIACFQVERRLEGQRTILMYGAVTLCNLNRPDLIPVQIKKRIKPNRRWRFKMRRSREREKINSRSRCREFPWCQIHGVSLVQPRQLERNRKSFCSKCRISLDVEVDRRRFDVGISDPFLFVCKQNQLDKQ